MKKKELKFINIFKLDNEMIEKVRCWRNKEHVRKYMFNQHEITKEEHLAYIEGLKNSSNKGLYVIYLDNEAIGVFQYKINPKGNFMESGNYITEEKFLNCGYGVIILYTIIEIAFKHLKVNKVYSEIIESNKKVISMHKKMGIVEEGILRKQIIINNKYYDIHQFGIFEYEWEKCKPKKIIDKFIINNNLEDILIN